MACFLEVRKLILNADFQAEKVQRRKWVGESESRLVISEIKETGHCRVNLLTS